MVPGLNQTNHGVYALIPEQTKPTKYSTASHTLTPPFTATAYNETRDTILVPNINQTNYGVQTALYNANMTCNLLYSPGAMFLQFWSENFATTGDVSQANNYAYSTTDAALQAADPTAYTAYTSNILNLFYSEWLNEFTTPAAATATAIQASATTTQTYIASLTNTTEQEFATAVTGTLTFENFLSYNSNPEKHCSHPTCSRYGCNTRQRIIHLRFRSLRLRYNPNPDPTNQPSRARSS